MELEGSASPPGGWCGLAPGHCHSSHRRACFHRGVFCPSAHGGAPGGAAAEGSCLCFANSSGRTGIAAGLHWLPWCQQRVWARPCLQGLAHRQRRLPSTGGVPELTRSQTWRQRRQNHPPVGSTSGYGMFKGLGSVRWLNQPKGGCRRPGTDLLTAAGFLEFGCWAPAGQTPSSDCSGRTPRLEGWSWPGWACCGASPLQPRATSV